MFRWSCQKAPHTFYKSNSEHLVRNHFKICFTKILLYYLAMCFLTIIHFKLSVTKDFFLILIKKDVFRHTKMPTATILKKCLPTKIS